MPHIMTVAVFACVVALGAGCGSESEPSNAGAGDSVNSGTTIDVTYQDGKVSPSGERVQVALDSQVTFNIDADAPGELHVHSAAGDEIEFDAGKSEHTLTVEQPGIVEVELHGPDLVVVQLEVE